MRATVAPNVGAMDRYKALLCDIGRRIAEVRAVRALTQEAFAEQMGWSPRYLQSLEHGTEAVSLRQLVRVADALGMSVRDLFEPPQSREVKVGRPRRKRAPKTTGDV